MQTDSQLSVILVDDDPEEFVLTQELFQEIEGLSYRLEWVPDYELALERIRSRQDDVCLLDYSLGQRSGLELLQQAREEGCNTPMILLTGRGTSSVEREALAAGAADYLVKGKTKADDLSRALRHALQRNAERMASIGTLAAGIAHEINAPLATVVASLELVRHDLASLGAGLGSDELGVALSELRDASEAAERVRQIVRDLRAFSGPGDERIVRSLSGEITVRTRVGHGTTFRGSLPADRRQARHSSVAPAPLGPAISIAGEGVCVAERLRKRVLLIDDEPMIVRVASRALSRLFEVEGVTDAREALRRISAGKRYDLILCDLMMPGLTGMDFHEQLAATAPALLPRLVFVTGGAFTPRAVQFLAQVPNCRVEKPFDPAALVRLVHELTDDTLRSALPHELGDELA